MRLYILSSFCRTRYCRNRRSTQENFLPSWGDVGADGGLVRLEIISYTPVGRCRDFGPLSAKWVEHNLQARLLAYSITDSQVMDSNSAQKHPVWHAICFLKEIKRAFSHS